MKNQVIAFIGSMMPTSPAPRAGGEDAGGAAAPAVDAATGGGPAYQGGSDPGGDLFGDADGMSMSDAFEQGAIRTDRDGNKLPPRFEEARGKQGEPQKQTPPAPGTTPAEPGTPNTQHPTSDPAVTPDFSKMTPDEIVTWANQRAETGGEWAASIAALKAQGFENQAAVDAKIAENARVEAEAARAKTETETVTSRLDSYWKQLVAGAQRGEYTMDAAKEAYLAEHALVSREVKAEMMTADATRQALSYQTDRALAEFSNIADGEGGPYGADVRNLIMGVADSFGVTPQAAAAHLDAIVARAIQKRMAAAAVKMTAAIQTAQQASPAAAAPVMRGSTGGIATPNNSGSKTVTEDDDWSDLAKAGFLRRRD